VRTDWPFHKNLSDDFMCDFLGISRAFKAIAAGMFTTRRRPGGARHKVKRGQDKILTSSILPVSESEPGALVTPPGRVTLCV
jgi:hypothetical protein